MIQKRKRLFYIRTMGQLISFILKLRENMRADGWFGESDHLSQVTSNLRRIKRELEAQDPSKNKK